ncbi:MAG: PaaI family thioesterase [Acidimicrobiia bacterium]|nr:PaaI family thioesterase [Acidimicrobiia bacterium]
MEHAPVDHPFADLLGFEVAVTGEGQATASLRPDGVHLNPNGVPHGAVLFALVDTSMGGATMSVLPSGCFCASVEVHLRFLRPATGAVLVARTRVVRAGRRIVQLDAEVRSGPTADENEPLVATATGSFAVLGTPDEPTPGPGTS